MSDRDKWTWTQRDGELRMACERGTGHIWRDLSNAAIFHWTAFDLELASTTGHAQSLDDAKSAVLVALGFQLPGSYVLTSVKP